MLCVTSLQLNIGIIAACASFLKPLVGRFLKINSSAAYYASSQQYNRSGRTPLSGGIGESNAYTNSKRRAGLNTRNEDDEFVRHIKNDVRVSDIRLQDLKSSPVETKIQSAQSSAGDYCADAIYDMPSHTNSEEVILQNPNPSNGIMRTRDVTLKYSNKVTG
jgi:CCR4-NOT transcriptional regulation complex NOT5 subunit